MSNPEEEETRVVVKPSRAHLRSAKPQMQVEEGEISICCHKAWVLRMVCYVALLLCCTHL